MRTGRLQKTLALLTVLAMCIGMLPAAAAEGYYEESAYGESAYWEPVYEEYGYEEPVYTEPVYAEPVQEDAPEPTAGEEPVAVCFLPEPAAAQITVYDPARTGEYGEVLSVRPDESGTYWLLPGAYLVDVVCEGYESFLNVPLTVEAEPLTLPVTLTPLETDEPADEEPLVEALVVEEPVEEEPTVEELVEDLVEDLTDEDFIVEEPAAEDLIVEEPFVEEPFGEGSFTEGPFFEEQPLVVPNAVSNAVTESGTCGNNLSWSFDSATGTLTISGTGKMSRYSSDSTPWYSFRDQIKSILITDGVTSVGSFAFYSCTALTSVTLPDTVTTISSGAFDHCSSLTDVTIPEGVKKIEYKAFSYCLSLTSISIPESVTAIQMNAFEHCSSLTDVSIPEGVKTIEYGTFEACSSLTDVIIPDNVTSIKSRAFACCTGLTNVTIPGSVASLGKGAFYLCTGLTGVTISDGVTALGENSFYGCSGLTSVSIPASVMSIGKNAFSRCSGLSDLQVSENNPYYCAQGDLLLSKDGTELVCFTGANGGDIVIPAGVTSIGDYLFSFCSNLTSVRIPEGVRSIGDGAFSYCSNLTSVNIPAGVTSIPNSTFHSCKKLASVTIPEGVTSIGQVAFVLCESLTELNLPSTLRSFGDSAFCYCDGLTSVTIPGGVETIPYDLFADCRNLASVTILDGVKTIVSGAFSNCGRLKTITIPKSVTRFPSSPFNSCYISNVYYYGSMSDWRQIENYNNCFRDSTIHYLPAISIQPEPKTVSSGQTARFFISAEGSDLHYQWQRLADGVWTDLSGSDYTGVDTTYLTVKNTAEKHEFLFRCAVSSDMGTIYTEEVMLKVKPVVSAHPVSATVGEGHDAVFTASFTGTGLSYRWQASRGGSWEAVTGSGYSGADSPTLTVTATAEMDGLRFRCLAWNSGGEVFSYDAKLTVVAKPKITGQPRGTEVKADETAVFTVTASSTGLSYQWQYLSGGAWKNIGAGSCTGYTTATLKVPAKGHANMQVRCAVKNGGGTVYSNSVKLTVTGQTVRYRALLVGNENYRTVSNTPGCRNDALAMATMLSGLTNKFTCTKLYDATKSEIISKIRSTFSDATANDVSLFFYAGHGVGQSNTAQHGALVGIDSSFLTTKELASELSRIPGRVIVILDSCYSGAAIRSNGLEDPLDAINQSVIDVFAEYDTVLESDGVVPNSGELATSKFVVITAASNTQTSASGHDGSIHYGYFTISFVTGCGYHYLDHEYYEKMPADKNGDRKLSVTEIYTYARDLAKSMHRSQTAQCYAANMNEILFSRK